MTGLYTAAKGYIISDVEVTCRSLKAFDKNIISTSSKYTSKEVI